MSYANQDLLIIHAHACATVLKADKTLTPEVDAFWPLYLRAVLTAPHQVASVEARDENDTARIDWLERNATSASYFDLVTLTFISKESVEDWKNLREMIDFARHPDEDRSGDDA